MIKALTPSSAPGPSVMILGLSDENWRHLREGQPIAVKISDLEPDRTVDTVVLIAGATEEEMYEDLRARMPVREVHHPEGGPQ
jgi:hypothetical protein